MILSKIIDDFRKIVTFAFTAITLSYMRNKMDEIKLLLDYVISPNKVIDVKTTNKKQD